MVESQLFVDLLNEKKAQERLLSLKVNMLSLAHPIINLEAHLIKLLSAL